jgi:hypothetical protein
MKNSDVAFLVFAVLLVGYILGSIISTALLTQKMHKEAVEAGCAKYICNEKNKSFFTYIRNTN